MTAGARRIVREFSDDPAMESEYGFDCWCWLKITEGTRFPHTDVEIESRYPYRKIKVITSVTPSWNDYTFFDETEVVV